MKVLIILATNRPKRLRADEGLGKEPVLAAAGFFGRDFRASLNRL